MNPMTRRSFMKTGAAGALAASPILSAFAESGLFAEEAAKDNPLIWGVLLHLGHNMWGDTQKAYTPPVDTFTFEEPLWDELTEKASQLGLNMVVIDLGEGVRYKSHPEIAIEGAWSVEKLREELNRLRGMGLEPIPKLNFSACHDFWLGPYARMVSTQTYYEVCADLIKEVVEIFDRPRFFHLGYDEETYDHQASLDYVVVRQGELWKHDFLFFIDQCEKNSVRPWIWADYAWNHKDFLEWAPKSVVMSNWYYEDNFDPASNRVIQCYLDLDAAGYDQIPTGSDIWDYNENFGKTVKFGRDNISKERLLGFLQAPWRFTEQKYHELNFRSLQQVGDAIKDYEN
ncbi:MAG: twin-arginine translocation signal domain-containing protein [Thermoguttaceae bacterium]|jgi:hypothetical protein|nr:twin-arginine translocation signal domain-containing protein [Thermoguttaceae bacterium]